MRREHVGDLPEATGWLSAAQAKDRETRRGWDGISNQEEWALFLPRSEVFDHQRSISAARCLLYGPMTSLTDVMWYV